VSTLSTKCTSWNPRLVQPYRRKFLNEYSGRMNHDDGHELEDSNVGQVLAMTGFNVRSAPRSVYEVGQLYEALDRYAPIYAKRPEGKEINIGISFARTCFGRPLHVKELDALPLDARTVRQITLKPTASAGLTAYGKHKSEAELLALERAKAILRDETSPRPCLAYYRTQANNKTRLIWGYPYEMTVLEGLVARPLIENFGRFRTPMTFQMSVLEIGAKLRNGSRNNLWAYSLDMSKFDSSVPGNLIHQAFKILKSWYDLEQIVPQTSSTVGELFDILESYFVCTPIVMPDQNLYLGKRHGVPSGSYFTQLIDSIVNCILAGAISFRFNMNINKDRVCILGDDLLVFSNVKVDLDGISDWVFHTFSMKVHGAEKSAVTIYSEDLHFLGRNWRNGVPWLDEEEILAKMKYPERFRRYSSDPELRNREVKLLFDSYASEYSNAWFIIEEAYHPQGCSTFRSSERWDCDIRSTNCSMEDNPDHLSGLMRYNRIYNSTDHGFVASLTNLFK